MPKNIMLRRTVLCISVWVCVRKRLVTIRWQLSERVRAGSMSLYAAISMYPVIFWNGTAADTFLSLKTASPKEYNG